MARRPGGNRTTPATRIAGTFSRAAMGPIEYAASCIMGNKIQSGLEELGPDGLRDAYHRGLSDVAKLVGVPRAEVERVVPLEEVAGVEGRLRASHPTAIAAWKLHAGQFGFLDVVTALTVDGRKPDIRMILERVATKVKHDKELAQPIAALGGDVAAWSQLVTRTQAVLEDLTWLTTALRRRVLMRIAFSTFVLVMLVGLTTAIVSVRLARDNARGRIAAASDCDAEKLSSKDLDWATKEGKKEVEDKKARCAATRATEETARREEQARVDRERAAKDAVDARVKACTDLAAGVESGTLTDADKATAGDAAALLGRVATKSLEPADIGPADPTFPCDDNATAHGKLQAAYTVALLIDPLLWARRGEPSPYAEGILVANKDSIPIKVRIGIADNAEQTAKKGLNGGNKEIIAKAKKLCAFAKSLGVSGHGSCHAVTNLP